MTKIFPKIIKKERDLTFLLRNPQGIKTNGGVTMVKSLRHGLKQMSFLEDVLKNTSGK